MADMMERHGTPQRLSYLGSPMSGFQNKSVKVQEKDF